MQEGVVVVGVSSLLGQSIQLRAGIEIDFVSLDFDLTGQVGCFLSVVERNAKPSLYICNGLVQLKFVESSLLRELFASLSICFIGLSLC